MSRRFLRAIGVALLLGVLPLAGGLRAGADEGVRVAVTQLDVSAFPDIHIVASVTDAQGQPVRGLSAADLKVREGAVDPSAVISLASETSPVALAFVLDTSGSMGGRPLADAKRAMVSLIDALGPTDQASVITFAVDVRVERGLTGDKRALVAATNAAAAGGNTAIYDALAAAVGVLDAAPPNARRAIVLLTDGIDNSSRLKPAAVLASIGSAQIATNVVGLGGDLDRVALGAIAAAAPGGQLIEAPTSTQLGAIYASLGQQLLSQYSVTYRSPSQATDGSAISVDLILQKAGTVLAAATVTFQVPVGRGMRPPTAAPTPPAIARVDPIAAPQPAAAPVRMSSELVGLLGAAAVLTLLLWISDLASRYPSRQRRRLEVFVRGLALATPGHAKRRSIIQRVLVPSLRSAGRPLLRITPAGVITSTRDRLQAAGEPMGLGPVEFLGVRAGLGMLGAIAGLGSVTAVTGDAGAAPFGALAGIVMGYVTPGFVVDRFGKRRKAAIRRALPAALDMLALSAEAGLSFDGAIGQVAHRWQTPLSDEFRRLLVELQMGRERRQALREMAHRTGLPELSRFAAAVIQADSLGVPLSRVLHEQSSEIRLRRRQRAEEAAQKAPVKMLFPMVFLIFPALFVVVLGPAIPRLLEAFSAFN